MPDSTPTVEDVLGEFGPMLSRTVATYEHDRALQQDLLQEISIALWRSLARWRGDGPLKGYVARIAHNCCADHVARHAPRAETELADSLVDPEHSPVEHAQTQQSRRTLLECVRLLPLGQRQVVVLSLEGFSLVEIAHALMIEQDATAQRMSRARRTLRELMSK
ncbi:RNA polymerase sigma factor [Lysobacter sp. A3-1-A15]|uniref:RNA polymerase sigma factor n=1 Tax=Novilysobacter viscosus TaxID=3098602 RepID=UPI002ED9DD2A